ncbi:MAG: hypothetical protein KDB14_11455 [Planctomycetales bacterium]|nr:hypothetical protein [Planctomycetales bacterium]
MMYSAIAADRMTMESLLAAVDTQFEIHVGAVRNGYATAMSAEQSALDNSYANAAKGVGKRILAHRGN